MASSAPSAASCSMDVVSSSGSESGPPTAFLARPSGNGITLAYWQGKGEAARVEYRGATITRVKGSPKVHIPRRCASSGKECDVKIVDSGTSEAVQKCRKYIDVRV